MYRISPLFHPVESTKTSSNITQILHILYTYKNRLSVNILLLEHTIDVELIGFFLFFFLLPEKKATELEKVVKLNEKYIGITITEITLRINFKRRRNFINLNAVNDLTIANGAHYIRT